MPTPEPPRERTRGVTPGFSRDYALRTAERQGAFVVPFLRPGLRLLDAGCGPGSITVGLAAAVAPGPVLGIDSDPEHVAAARALAASRGVENATFEVADALAMPLADASVDLVFENNLLVHLAERAIDALREFHRILVPGGLVAVRDTQAEAAVWGHRPDALREFDRLFFAWHAARGSDLSLAARLPSILLAAGFGEPIVTVSADTKGTPDEVREHATTMHFLLDGPLGREALARGWADVATLERLAAAADAWGEEPDAFFANVHVEVVARKAP